MTIDEKLAKLEQLSMQIEGMAAAHQCEKNFSTLQIVAIACLEVTTEHIRSVAILTRRFHYNTALAMMRVEIESLVRAFWWTHCATPEDYEKLKSDKFVLNYGKMETELESSGQAKLFQTVETMRKNITAQHSYTHTGREQIFGRLASGSRGSVGGAFDEKTSEQLFGINEALLVLVAGAYSRLFDDPVFNMTISMVTEQFDCVREAGISAPRL